MRFTYETEGFRVRDLPVTYSLVTVEPDGTLRRLVPGFEHALAFAVWPNYLLGTGGFDLYVDIPERPRRRYRVILRALPRHELRESNRARRGQHRFSEGEPPRSDFYAKTWLRVDTARCLADRGAPPTGIPDFRSRLLRATTILAWLVKRRSEDETERIKREAAELFGDAEGKLDLEALANAPRTAREEQQLREKHLLASLNLL